MWYLGLSLDSWREGSVLSYRWRMFYRHSIINHDKSFMSMEIMLIKDFWLHRLSRQKLRCLIDRRDLTSAICCRSKLQRLVSMLKYFRTVKLNCVFFQPLFGRQPLSSSSPWIITSSPISFSISCSIESASSTVTVRRSTCVEVDVVCARHFSTFAVGKGSSSSASGNWFKSK